MDLEDDSLQFVQRLRNNLQSELQSIQLFFFTDVSRYGKSNITVNDVHINS